MSYRGKRAIWRLGSFLVLLISFGIYLVINPNSYQQELNNDAAIDDEVHSKELQSEANSLFAKDVLESLAVKEKDESQKYYRKLFYDDWATDKNGCSTREVILKRDLKDVVLNACKVMSGTLDDPYTGKIVNFVRGQNSSSAVQIDHVVALSNAWTTGANQFDEKKRHELSQDPLNLLAVEGSANQEKSDQDAASWLPINKSFQCQYVARQISVKYKYRLWVTTEEKAMMRQVLSRCPDEATVGLSNL